MQVSPIRATTPSTSSHRNVVVALYARPNGAWYGAVAEPTEGFAKAGAATALTLGGSESFAMAYNAIMECSSVKGKAAAPFAVANSAAALHIGPCLLPIGRYVVVVVYLYGVDFHSVDRFDLCGGRGAFKPSGRTPGILVRNFYESVLDRVLMGIV